MARPPKGKQRSTVPAGIYDGIIPTNAVQAGSEAEPETEDEKGSPPKKKHMTFLLTVDTTERVKNAVYWTPGLTLADLADQALREAVDRLEKERGKPFEKRAAELKGGFPIR
jgi:hypothetical protein